MRYWWKRGAILLRGISTSSPCRLSTALKRPNIILLSEEDVLGERIARRTNKKKKTSAAFFAEAAAFNESDLVVHKEHGIGKFAGADYAGSERREA